MKAVFDLIIQYANYNRAIKLTPDVTVTFRNAGHILGSATLQIDINEDGHKKHWYSVGILAAGEI
ncbi:metallo-beta-lactamase family protein RNA-specific [Photobacterium aphoticum]|uniref:Metallo-beta-lactamase family protein RNA-specific n=1 Tax=Photobacterium aphoticum TaxID=754436 RepID=A0A090QJU3_9GAMM|nr:metallo-beta-lactamase family protein RNA-specific [Photobacterium aphoticum]